MSLSFFAFLMPLIEGRLIQFGKSIPFGKSQGFPELYVKRNRILWILAERYNILSVNSVEKWGYDESWIQFGKTSYDLAKAGSLYQLYKVSPNDMRLKNIGKAQKI